MNIIRPEEFTESCASDVEYIIGNVSDHFRSKMGLGCTRDYTIAHAPDGDRFVMVRIPFARKISIGTRDQIQKEFKSAGWKCVRLTLPDDPGGREGIALIELFFKNYPGS